MKNLSREAEQWQGHTQASFGRRRSRPGRVSRSTVGQLYVTGEETYNFPSQPSLQRQAPVLKSHVASFSQRQRRTQCWPHRPGGHLALQLPAEQFRFFRIESEQSKKSKSQQIIEMSWTFHSSPVCHKGLWDLRHMLPFKCEIASARVLDYNLISCHDTISSQPSIKHLHLVKGLACSLNWTGRVTQLAIFTPFRMHSVYETMSSNAVPNVTQQQQLPLPPQQQQQQW